MMRKIGFRNRNSSDQDAVIPQSDEAPNPELTSSSMVTRPEFHNTLSADSICQKAFQLSAQNRVGQGGRHASFANSLFPGTVSYVETLSDSHAPDLLGLQLICDNTEPQGDIIFVHGLGGTAMRTWSWKRDVNHFWPVWLGDEQELSSFRIFSFGYNSNFKGVRTNLNTIDFAKDLLFSMLTFSGGLGDHPDERTHIGAKPIIFVAHSMGGLVVKKAYTLGKHDKQYSELIAKVFGIVFLATPHRGAQYAKMLNNILSTAPLGAPPKAYVAELDTHSSSLQDINEQFRIGCEELALASFFETKKTNFGVTKLLVRKSSHQPSTVHLLIQQIVEKESGILGYPQETSIPLNADHHSICKFESREDANYISVKNLLKHWVSRLRTPPPKLAVRRRSSNVEIKHLQAILGIRESAETDLGLHRDRILAGTCQWITTKQDFVCWHKSIASSGPEIFWLVGLPATGKTSLARCVIDHLRFLGHDSAYHFFSSGHQLKRTAAYCLRSIAYQLAQSNDEFREQLCNLVDGSGLQFNSQTQHFGVIWEKVFEGIVFKLKLPQPIFLVMDGIDESDSQALLITNLMKLQSLTPIKIFLTSRPMKIPSGTLSPASLRTCFLHEEDTQDDIRAYIQNVVRNALPDDPNFQDDIIGQVMAKASGSFLWVKLALETLQDNWHTRDDIRKVLTEVPKGMEQLYRRMLDSISCQSPRLQEMAKRILTWAICCWRPLSVTELQVALQPEFDGFVRLENTIVQICGHFISVDNSKITLVHATARTFLLNGTESLPPFINPREGHEHVAMVCLKHLSTDKWRLVFKGVEMSRGKMDSKGGPSRLQLIEKSHPLLAYATFFWAYHVSKSSSRSPELMAVLGNFLTKFTLSWIEAVALSNNLRHLTRSAQYLKAFAKRRSRGTNIDANGHLFSLQEPSKDDSNLINPWANDFIRVAGKFGRNLVQSPSSIYRLVPPFCPQQSMIGATYCVLDAKNLSIAGMASEGWDDCLASVSVGDDQLASRVLATDAYFITLTSSNGVIIIWHAETSEEARRICHGEYVPIMTLNRSGTRLATAGFSTYRVWDLSTGKELYRMAKSTEALTMALAFGSADSDLIIGLDDCSVTCHDLEISAMKFRFVACDPLQDEQGCPRLMVISPDLKRLAIAWRGSPLLVWDMTQSIPPQRCRVSGSFDPLNAPELVRWQPNGNSVLILCQSSKIIEWNLYDEEQTEYGKYHDINAREMTISADGNLLLTSDNVGTMSVWTFPRLQLIFRLVNGNEFIRDVAFGPSGQRFYDTRDSICNVWEPDALVRPDDIDLEDTSSTAESFAASEPVISHDESSENQVTSFAAGPDDAHYCCGKQDGSVVIHEAIGGRRVRKVYNHTANCSVIELAWSPNGRFIVSSDDSGRVISKRLEIKEASKWAVFPGLDIRVGEAVQQFVFSNDEKLLLISTTLKDRVWDLKRKKEVCMVARELRREGKWMADHMNPEILLWVDNVQVCSYRWANLKCDDLDHPQTTISEPGDQSRGTIRRIALTKDKRNLVYEVVPLQVSKGSRIFILSTSSLSHSWEVDLSGQVKKMVGTFQDRIVFLDHDFWICTWQIDAKSTDIKRHFFLPKDWLNANTLQMATLNESGTFFCPKFGNVIIVRNGMRI